MTNLLLNLVAFAALFGLCCCSTTFLDSKKQNFYVKTSKSLDYKLRGKNDDHRFGFEIKENKQFHHTKTAEDGVRIGCFSHILNDVTYLTHYVADAKGYRLVPYDKVITVYPKDDGKPRKASFSEAFNKEELKRANIVYIFPEGCQAESAEISRGRFINGIAEIPAAANINEQIVENGTQYVEQEQETGTEDNTPNTTSIETSTSDEEVCEETCCEESRPQLIFPEPSSCCSNVSKLIIPIDLTELVKISMTDIVELSNESDPIRLLLKLLRILETCRNQSEK